MFTRLASMNGHERLRLVGAWMRYPFDLSLSSRPSQVSLTILCPRAYVWLHPPTSSPEAITKSQGTWRSVIWTALSTGLNLYRGCCQEALLASSLAWSLMNSLSVHDHVLLDLQVKETMCLCPSYNAKIGFLKAFILWNLSILNIVSLKRERVTMRSWCHLKNKVLIMKVKEPWFILMSHNPIRCLSFKSWMVDWTDPHFNRRTQQHKSIRHFRMN